MTLDLTAPADDPTGAYAAVLEAVTRAPDPAASLRVTAWILSEMADTFLMLAFADACDECDDADMPHPDKPGPGGNYADHPEPAPEVRAEAERAAVRLYAAILAAPGGYDPAPAVMRYTYRVAPHWRKGNIPQAEANARCWGHYAVMEARGHGVAWSDSNEPLFVTDNRSSLVELPSVFELLVSAEDVTWSDAPTDAARVVLDERDARIDAARAEADEDEARVERAAARKRTDGEG